MLPRHGTLIFCSHLRRVTLSCLLAGESAGGAARAVFSKRESKTSFEMWLLKRWRLFRHFKQRLDRDLQSGEDRGPRDRLAAGKNPRWPSFVDAMHGLVQRVGHPDRPPPPNPDRIGRGRASRGGDRWSSQSRSPGPAASGSPCGRARQTVLRRQKKLTAGRRTVSGPRATIRRFQSRRNPARRAPGASRRRGPW